MFGNWIESGVGQFGAGRSIPGFRGFKWLRCTTPGGCLLLACCASAFVAYRPRQRLCLARLQPCPTPRGPREDEAIRPFTCLKGKLYPGSHASVPQSRSPSPSEGSLACSVACPRLAGIKSTGPGTTSTPNHRSPQAQVAVGSFAPAAVRLLLLPPPSSQHEELAAAPAAAAAAGEGDTRRQGLAIQRDRRS